MNNNAITRTVAIEHAGEKISIEVHIHLTEEEIERVICPAVDRWMAKRARLETQWRAEHRAMTIGRNA